MGKSALLEAAVRMADGMTVLSAHGVESESELPFAGLHQLLRGVLAHLPRLPPPQTEHLRAALGLSAAPPVDRFLVSAAVLGLLAEAAEDRPLVCVVDDAHWLDAASAEALLFAARRLRAEPVAIVFAAREDGLRSFDARGVAECHLPGLDLGAATDLLGDGGGVAVPHDICTRLVAATGGKIGRAHV